MGNIEAGARPQRLIRENLAKESSNDPSKNKGNKNVSGGFGNIKKPLKKCISKNEEKWVLLEKVVFPLTGLWNKWYIEGVPLYWLDRYEGWTLAWGAQRYFPPVDWGKCGGRPIEK